MNEWKHCQREKQTQDDEFTVHTLCSEFCVFVIMFQVILESPDMKKLRGS